MGNGHVAMMLVLALHAAVVAQAPEAQTAVQEPTLTARQREASRALADMYRPVVERPRPSLLAEPRNREIFLDNPLYDPTSPTSVDGQLRESSCAADLVVVGTVQELQSFLNENASFILTEYTIRVEETFRGRPVPPASTISYVRSGGSMNIAGRIVTASHNLFPPLLRGQKYVLFVNSIRQGAGLYKPIGRGALDVLEGEARTRGLGPRAVPGLRAGLDPAYLRQAVTHTTCEG